MILSPPAKKIKKTLNTPVDTVLPKKKRSTTNKRLVVAAEKMRILQYIVNVQKSEIRMYRLQLNKSKKVPQVNHLKVM